MEIAKVSISGVSAQTMSASPIPVGIIGSTVTLEFNDPTWDGLTKNVVFVGAKDVEVLDVQDRVVLPAEVITAPNILVRMGICGIAADGSLAIPTLWADLGVTRPGTPVNMGSNPTLPIWAQLMNMIGSPRNLNTDARDNLVNAINETLSKIAETEDGKDGEDGEDGGYYTPEVTQPTSNTMEIAFSPSKADMPAVEKKTITLPGSDSGQNGNGGGLSTTAANLLIEILESAVYNANVTGKIANLKEALASGGSGGGDAGSDSGEDTPDEPTVTDDITVADGVMTIVSVGSAITVSDGTMTIA